MNPSPYHTLTELLANTHSRPDTYPVAMDAERIVRWKEFRELIAVRRRTPGLFGAPGARRRVLLAEQSALDFLVRLLAILADGDVPVLPPNFQSQTLDSLSSLPTPDDVPATALELYTSGSSGEPKRVLKRLAQLDAECRVQESCWGKLAGDATIIATTPFHHIYGLLFRLLWPLCSGRIFDNATLADPATLAARLTTLDGAILISSPAHLSRLPETMASGPRKPRLVFSSGGPLRADTAAFVSQLWGSAPVEIYGSTESGGIAWRRQTDDAHWTLLPEVVADTAADRALLVRSPFIGGDAALRMEDTAELHGDGRFSLGVRLDRIVKIEEKRLSLPEMETWLAAHTAVAACALAPMQIEGRDFIGAVVVPHPGHGAEQRKLLVEKLKDHLCSKFDRVLLPRRWRFVEQLPYNERGKLPAESLLAVLNTPL
jgi:acyl-coenzyme A synthetase/AMP-(fatty) acid ligase